jgi:hypothetical protein
MRRLTIILFLLSKKVNKLNKDSKIYELDGYNESPIYRGETS